MKAFIKNIISFGLYQRNNDKIASLISSGKAEIVKENGKTYLVPTKAQSEPT